MTSTSANGAVTTITYGAYQASVTEVGGALCTLTHAGRDLVVPYDVDAPRPNHRGSVLAPWPNRIGDGRYTFEGTAQQLPLSEPARRNAIHGLSSWLGFAASDVAADRVSLTARIWPQTGYPFALDVTAVYRLDGDGLHWDVVATNVGSGSAPYGCSVHPYLVAGEGHVDDWTLLVPADQVLEVDPDRLLPRGVEPLADALDFRSPRLVGDTQIDHAYTAITQPRVALRAADGLGVCLSFDPSLHWVQIHTADRPEPDRNRIGMAVEPMTCPPDAFRSGTDLVVLAPGGSHTTSLLISALF